MARIIPINALSVLTHLATSGNDMAEAIVAIMNTFKVVELTNDAEGDTAADTIRVTGQVKDLDGSDVRAVTSISLRATRGASGGSAVTLTVVTGTVKAGDGTVALWLETTSTGSFSVDVLEDGTGDDLVEMVLDGGFTETLKLTYA